LPDRSFPCAAHLPGQSYRGKRGSRRRCTETSSWHRRPHISQNYRGAPDNPGAGVDGRSSPPAGQRPPRRGALSTLDLLRAGVGSQGDKPAGTRSSPEATWRRWPSASPAEPRLVRHHRFTCHRDGTPARYRRSRSGRPSVNAATTATPAAGLTPAQCRALAGFPFDVRHPRRSAPDLRRHTILTRCSRLSRSDWGPRLL
jgi:hypothetical protein